MLQVSHCQHQCHYCYLSAASSINKTAEAYSKLKFMLFNHLSNYHYLLTKKKNYSSVLNICCYLTWDSCHGSFSSAEAACALPNSLKKLLFHGYQRVDKSRSCSEFSTSAGFIVSFQQKQGCYHSLFHYFLPLVACNHPLILCI